VMDSGAKGPGFKSQSQRCRVTVLGKLFTPIEGKCKWSYGPSCPVDFSLNIFIHSFIHCASVYQAAKLVAALLRVAGVTAGLAESNGSLPPGL